MLYLNVKTTKPPFVVFNRAEISKKSAVQLNQWL